jgi:hypothetical protein
MDWAASITVTMPRARARAQRAAAGLMVPVVLERCVNAKIFTSGDAGNVMSCQAEFDCEVAANGSCANNGYAQRHDGEKLNEIDIRRCVKVKVSARAAGSSS